MNEEISQEIDFSLINGIMIKDCYIAYAKINSISVERKMILIVVGNQNFWIYGYPEDDIFNMFYKLRDNLDKWYNHLWRE